MKRYIFLISGIILLVINILFIGLLKYNDQNLAELFIKHRPNLVMTFSPENTSQILYKEFILDYNIPNQQKSMLPLILIQLMLSCFSASLLKMDLKRKAIVFGIHFILGFCVFFQIIAYALNLSNPTLTLAICIAVIPANYLLVRVLTR